MKKGPKPSNAHPRRGRHHLSQIPCVCGHIAGIMVRSAEELFAVYNKAAHGMGNKRSATAVNDEAVVVEAALGVRDGVAQRWRPRGEEACLCLVFHFSRPSVLSSRTESPRENTMYMISPPSSEECFFSVLTSCESDAKSYG